MLGEKLHGTVEQTADAMRPAHARPPFHQQLSPKETLLFWAKHRYDQIGQRVLQSMTPVQIAQLDAWLAHILQATTPGAVQREAPVNTPPQSPASLLNQAMHQESRGEGVAGGQRQVPLGPELA